MTLDVVPAGTGLHLDAAVRGGHNGDAHELNHVVVEAFS
jgi:hypothetical protein